MRARPQQFDEPEISGAVDNLSEGEFMDYILDELRTGKRQPLVRFSEEALQAMEDERVGEHFCRYPFLY